MTFASPGLSSISEGRHGNRQGKCGDVAWLQLIAGPDSLPAVVLVMGRSDGPIQGAAVLIMLLACLVITYVAMRLAEPLVQRLGQTGADVVGRISGVLSAGLAGLFVFDGLRQAALWRSAALLRNGLGPLPPQTYCGGRSGSTAAFPDLELVPEARHSPGAFDR